MKEAVLWHCDGPVLANSCGSERLTFQYGILKVTGPRVTTFASLTVK